MDLHPQRHDPYRAAQPEIESNRWTVPDLIDFDYYIDADEQAMRERSAARKELTKRDRRVYQERIRAAVREFAPEHSPQHRRAALRRWLEQRRETEDPALRSLLPGNSFGRSQRIVTIGLGVLGCVMGAGVASGLLQYDGRHPVNISWYLFVLVLLQILLATTTIAAWALRRSKPVQTAMEDVSLLSHPIRQVFSRVADWVLRQRLAHVSTDVRDRARTEAGLLQSHYALYGPVSFLPILIAAQVFGVGFNLGAFTATVALEWFSDLAFGWGSALDVQPETIHDLARIVALPWSWAFGEGLGYPTLEQIAGSRISLKDPLSTQAAGDLRAWRWFLVLALFTYGLLPRLMLLVLSVLTQARKLAALPFTHNRTQALYARMVTPSLDVAVAGSGKGPDMPIPQPVEPLTTPTAEPRPEPLPKQETMAPPATAIAADACVLMIHLDVAHLLKVNDHARLHRMLLAHTGWRVAASVTIGGGSAMADQAIALVRNGQWEAPPQRIVIIQDGSQPPITEHLRFLRTVRAQAGEQAQLLLALVGDPDGEDPLPPLRDFDFSDWQRRIEQMGDPYLRLERLTPHTADPASAEEKPR